MADKNVSIYDSAQGADTIFKVLWELTAYDSGSLILEEIFLEGTSNWFDPDPFIGEGLRFLDVYFEEIMWGINQIQNKIQVSPTTWYRYLNASQREAFTPEKRPSGTGLADFNAGFDNYILDMRAGVKTVAVYSAYRGMLWWQRNKTRLIHSDSEIGKEGSLFDVDIDELRAICDHFANLKDIGCYMCNDVASFNIESGKVGMIVCDDRNIAVGQSLSGTPCLVPVWRPAKGRGIPFLLGDLYDWNCSQGEFKFGGYYWKGKDIFFKAIVNLSSKNIEVEEFAESSSYEMPCADSWDILESWEHWVCRYWVDFLHTGWLQVADIENKQLMINKWMGWHSPTTFDFYEDSGIFYFAVAGPGWGGWPYASAIFKSDDWVFHFLPPISPGYRAFQNRIVPLSGAVCVASVNYKPYSTEETKLSIRLWNGDWIFHEIIWQGVGGTHHLWDFQTDGSICALHYENRIYRGVPGSWEEFYSPEGLSKGRLRLENGELYYMHGGLRVWKRVGNGWIELINFDGTIDILHEIKDSIQSSDIITVGT